MDQQRLLALLRNPFDNFGAGSRLIDPYPIPTSVYHVRIANIVVRTDASGNFSLQLSGNPFLPLLIMVGSLFDSGGMTQYTQNLRAWRALTPELLYAKLASWRLVCAGWQFRNLQPITSITGKFVVAETPGVDCRMLSYENLEATAMSLNRITTACCGQDLLTENGSIGGIIINLPNARDVGADELINGLMRLVVRPINYAGFAFKPSNVFNTMTNAATSGIGENYVDTVATGAIVQAGSDVVNMNGYNMFQIAGSGFPVNTNILELECVMHMEGSPSIATSSSGTGVNLVNEGAECVAGPGVMDRIMGVLTNEGTINLVSGVLSNGISRIAQAGMGNAGLRGSLARLEL
jgi:hypothetical protein